MRYPILFGLALSALSSGCAMSIPETPPYPPAASPQDPLPGASFCARTEAAARSLSSAQLGGAWTLTALGAGSGATGAIVTLVNVQEGRRIAGTGLALGGVALGIVAYTLFMRSEASGRLAQATNSAMLEKDDREAYRACVRAKAAWSAGKHSPEGITSEMLAERERENRKLKEEIEELKKKAGEGGKQELPPPLAPRR